MRTVVGAKRKRTIFTFRVVTPHRAPEEFSGHSLRAGFATSAAGAGATERDIMKHTRHKSEQMVRRYIRKGSLFKGNLVDSMGF
jgi:integrase